MDTLPTSLMLNPFDFQNIYNSSFTFNDNLLCCLMKFKATVHSGNIFVPKIILRSIQSYNTCGILLGNEYVLPLSANNQTVIKRTSKSILQEMMNVSYYHRRIRKVRCKEKIYYVGDGIILDEGFNPLIVWGFEMKMDNFSSCYKLFRRKILVSPKVLLNKSDILCKYLVNSGIPAILTVSSKAWRLNNIDQRWLTVEQLEIIAGELEGPYIDNIGVEISDSIKLTASAPVNSIIDERVIKKIFTDYKTEVINYGER